MIIGAWRSLVAHLHGVQGVGGSNPLAPIPHCNLCSLTLSYLHSIIYSTIDYSSRTPAQALRLY
jgi:hypothetical protein